MPRAKRKLYSWDKEDEDVVEEDTAPAPSTVPEKLVAKRQKKFATKIHAPWWSERTQVLSNNFGYNVKDKKDTNISWLTKVLHTGYENEDCLTASSCSCNKEKAVQTTTKRSKKVLQDNEMIVTRKIRIHPTTGQKKLFQRWFGITRFVYNEALRLVEEEKMHPSWKPLKMYLLNKEENKNASKYPWLFDKDLCPYDAKVSAVHELCSAIATTKESLKAKKKNPNKFEMKKRSKKDLHQSVHIDVNGGRPSVTWDKQGFKFWSRTGIGIVKPYRKRELKRLQGNGALHKATIKYETPNRYYLLIPIVTKKKTRTQEQVTSVIAFDPGVRTFQTGYTSQGSFVEYGKENINKIFCLGKQIDKLLSKIAKHTKQKYCDKREKQKYKNKRRMWRKKIGELRYRIQNLKRDMHWKVAKEIVQQHDHILISRFQVSEMVKKMDRKINLDTVKKMLHWSHFEFRQRLKHKAKEWNSTVHEVGEHYTSKTCGKCGKIHWKLGGSKHFLCPHCAFSIDRDFNGARNIFLMNIENHLKVRDPALL